MTKKTLPSNCYYIDTFAQASTHEMFNSSLMLMCSSVFNTVTCNISKSSKIAFQQVIDIKCPENLHFRNVYVKRGEKRVSLVLRYLISCLQNIRYLVMSPKDSIVIFPFNNLFCLWLVNFLNRALKRKIVIFCHSEMEGLIGDLNGLGLLHRILANLVRNFFLDSKVKISEGMYFSVMGDELVRNLATILDSDKLAKFISIDHPYIFKNNVTNSSGNIQAFNIGTVGTFSKKKGLNHFISLINELDLKIRSHINFSVTGRILGDFSILERLGVATVPENTGLSRDDFNKRVCSLDLILFFYADDSYKITASGAIFDAIMHEKPILALKNDYFSYIFGKFGNFGFLFSNTKDMADHLCNLIQSNSLPIIDFASLKDKFTPAKISHQLAEELNRIGYLIP